MKTLLILMLFAVIFSGCAYQTAGYTSNGEKVQIHTRTWIIGEGMADRGAVDASKIGDDITLGTEAENVKVDPAPSIEAGGKVATDVLSITEPIP